jgi:hypothetical protein
MSCRCTHAPCSHAPRVRVCALSFFAAQLIDRMLEEGVQPDGFTVAAVSARKSLRSYLKRGL